MCNNDLEEEQIILLMKKRYDKIKLESIESKGKIKVSCIQCKHSWTTSAKNALIFYLGCYECHKGKNYSMDEIKILKYIQENYIPNDGTFRHAESGGQIVIRPKPPKKKYQVSILLYTINVMDFLEKLIHMIKRIKN